MYKLTVIAGPNRGSTFPLNDGETTIGRKSENTIPIASSKVSKKHCSIVVNADQIIVSDLGSSNGTFVNGVLVKQKQVTVGDRVSVGDVVFQVVKAAVKSAGEAPAVGGMAGIQLETNSNPGLTSNPAPLVPDVGAPDPNLNAASVGSSIEVNQTPTDLKSKIAFLFEKFVMPFFYNLNLKNEWTTLCLGLFGVFFAVNLISSVSPLLQSSEKVIQKEVKRRAAFIASQIVEHNIPALSAGVEAKTEVRRSILNASGVRTAILTDLSNRIIAPASKSNQYFSSGKAAVYASKVANAFKSGRTRGAAKVVDGNIVVAVQPVTVLNPKLGRNVIVGMAVVAIDASLATPDPGTVGVVYSKTIIVSLLLAALILFVMYRLTVKPIEILSDDLDKALKGEAHQVSSEFKRSDLSNLYDMINSAIQRLPKDGGDGESTGPTGPAHDEYSSAIQMIGTNSGLGIVLFDEHKKVLYMNPTFEEISGIRADESIGQDMADVARDQAFAALSGDLFDRVQMGGTAEDSFDFSGVDFKLFISSFGTDSPTGFVLMTTRQGE